MSPAPTALPPCQWTWRLVDLAPSDGLLDPTRGLQGDSLYVEPRAGIRRWGLGGATPGAEHIPGWDRFPGLTLRDNTSLPVSKVEIAADSDDGAFPLLTPPADTPGLRFVISGGLSVFLSDGVTPVASCRIGALDLDFTSEDFDRIKVSAGFTKANAAISASRRLPAYPWKA